MITGATLLGYRKRYDTKTFFKKRFMKILIPLICWSALMMLWDVFITRSVNMPTSFASFFNMFMYSKFNSIYYFMFVILGIYITIPTLSPLSENKNRGILKYTIVAFFVLNTLIPDLLQFTQLSVNPNLKLQLAGWIILPLVGYYLNTTSFSKRQRILIYLLGAASVAYHFLITYCLSTSSGILKTPASDYGQFHVILSTSAIFVFFKNLRLKLSPRASGALKTLAGCSFGIFLCHILIMHYESAIIRHAFGLQTSSWIYRLLCPFLTYALCVGLVLILKKIPFLRRIVP